MNKNKRTLNNIRIIGLEALAKKLGPVGMIRFLQQFETGRGDYTKNRASLLGGVSVKDILNKSGRSAVK